MQIKKTLQRLRIPDYKIIVRRLGRRGTIALMSSEQRLAVTGILEFRRDSD